MEKNLFLNVLIETQILMLRCFTKNDKEKFFQIAQDPVSYETLPEDHMYNFEEISEIVDYFISRYSEDRINKIQKFVLAIILKQNNKMIGDAGIAG